MYCDHIMQQRAKAAASFFLFIVASNLSLCKAFVAANPLMTIKTLMFDGGRTVNTPSLQVTSLHSLQRLCRLHGEGRQIRPARNIFLPCLTLSGEDGSIRLPSRCISRRKQRVSVLAPLRMSSDHGSVEVVNPLSRDDPERARINDFITILAQTPTAEWKPAILDEYLSSLLKGNLYKQTMAERLAKVRSGEEREALTRVDAFLTGYIGQEKRKASRKKVSIILSAATEGATQLDEVVQILAKENLLDRDLKDYLNSLISGEENKCVQSSLLKVLRTVRDRIEAELKTGSRPEIRTLAQALQLDDPRERKEFLQHAFKRLESLDEFVKFVEEGIEYMRNDVGVALRSNMPQETFDKMKTIYAEAAAIRRTYLQ